MSKRPDKSPLSRVAQQPAIRHIVAAYPVDNDAEDKNIITNENNNESVNENVIIDNTVKTNDIKNESEYKSKNESESESKNHNVNAISEYIAKNSKKKFEELHTKDTYWVDNNILATLREITKGNKGLKTRIINDSLRAFFKKQGIKIKNED